mmetsp:Transcript_66838/g.178679  ORF Transcript_66838/g.178679 Transcript_66838/m.178679 type:complete len:204 (+) Transcript_66838:94-705(+)
MLFYRCGILQRSALCRYHNTRYNKDQFKPNFALVGNWFEQAVAASYPANRVPGRYHSPRTPVAGVSAVPGQQVAFVRPGTCLRPDTQTKPVFMDLHGPYETEYKNNFLFFTSTGRGRDPWHRLNEQTYDGVRLPGARMYWPQIQNTSLEMDFQNDGDDFYRQSSGDYGSGKPRPMHRRDGDRFANAKHIHGGHLNGLHLRRLE